MFPWEYQLRSQAEGQEGNHSLFRTDQYFPVNTVQASDRDALSEIT